MDGAGARDGRPGLRAGADPPLHAPGRGDQLRGLRAHRAGTDLLEHIEQRFDLIFMDSAKSKYIVFLPEVLKRLEVGGVVILDDIFQGGDVARDIMEVRRGQRTIYRGLQRLFDATLDHPGLTASLIPLGDGILMIRKNEEEISLPTEE